MLRIVLLIYLFCAANALLVVAMDHMLGFADRRAGKLAQSQQGEGLSVLESQMVSKEQFP